MEFRRH
jgi:hypothetical protein